MRKEDTFKKASPLASLALWNEYLPRASATPPGSTGVKEDIPDIGAIIIFQIGVLES
jgi:hypothetical protein